MGGNVFANGLEISGKAVQAQTIAVFPDVCFTPPENPATPPGIPIPYPSFGMASDTESGTATVLISEKIVNIKNKSDEAKTSGTEAGCAAKKGVITSKNTGKKYFNSWSSDVKFEGEPVIRFSDLATHNHASPAANTPPGPEIIKASPGVVSNTPTCLVGTHESIVSDCSKRTPPSQAHHIIPDRTYRANVKGEKNLAQYRVKGAPRYAKGMAVCLPVGDHTGKGGVHDHMDNALTSFGAKKVPPHVAKISEIRVHALAALGKLVPAKLSKECFQIAVLAVYAQTNPIASKSGRTSKSKLGSGSPGLSVLQKQGLG